MLMVLYLAIVTALAIPLGRYLAAVYGGTNRRSQRWLGGLERGIYRVLQVDPKAEHTWKAYAGGLLAFNAAGFIVLYVLLRAQGSLPFNPQGLPGVPPWIAFNTAVSFVTNTNWQAYGGESTMSYLSQMAGLSVQNFVSAAVGMAAAAALIRGIARRNSDRPMPLAANFSCSPLGSTESIPPSPHQSKEPWRSPGISVRRWSPGMAGVVAWPAKSLRRPAN